MDPTSRPATPAGDIAAWERDRAPDGTGPLLTPDLVALCQSGTAISLAIVTGDGRPLAGTGFACRVRRDGVLRILLGRTANPGFIEAVEAGRPVAVTFTGSRDHRAFQVKASSATLVPVCSDDQPEIDRQSALLRDGLMEIGFSPDLAAGFASYDRDSLVALELAPLRVFTQTPGPGAGAELVR